MILPCPCDCDCGEVTEDGDLCIACEHGQHVDDEE